MRISTLLPRRTITFVLAALTITASFLPTASLKAGEPGPASGRTDDAASRLVEEEIDYGGIPEEFRPTFVIDDRQGKIPFGTLPLQKNLDDFTSPRAPQWAKPPWEQQDIFDALSDRYLKGLGRLEFHGRHFSGRVDYINARRCKRKGIGLCISIHF